MIAKVALNIPFSEPFDYQIPPHLESKITIGIRVIVPLRKRLTSGVITEIVSSSPFSKLRPLQDIIEESPLFSLEMLNFCRWISAYYLCSLGEVIHSSLPPCFQVKFESELTLNQEHKQYQQKSDIEKQWLQSIKGLTQGQVQKTENYLAFELIYQQLLHNKVIQYKHVTPQKLRTHKAEKWYQLTDVQSFPQQRKNTKAYQVIEILEQQEVSRTKLLEKVPNAQAAIKKLVEQEILIEKKREILFFQKSTIESTPFFQLNEEQEIAFQAIRQAIFNQTFQTFLLHGVTGSGKTEVYLHAVRETLQLKKNVLILLPEIALTPQAVSHFRNKFGNQVAVLHSQMSDQQRFQEWWSIKNGKCSIVVGARSAIFAPLQNIGLIVVDEEHDLSYKQQDSPQYHARDLAVKLASVEKAVVILGSATPCAESYYNWQQKKYILLTLKNRANQKDLPPCEIINLKKTKRFPGIFYLSYPLVNELQETLEAGKQSIIFLNRRGYSAFLSCSTCETPVLCENCSIAMTWHKRKNQLICHYCGFQQPGLTRCSECEGSNFTEEGIGTQRIERDLQKLFPRANFLRLDRDNVTKRNDLENHLAKIREGKVQIIIGTQLISKGHDFPNIGLVCVILADMALNIPDFRSSERCFQLLSQVSGRGGRGKSGKGKTLFQSYNPNHFTIQSAQTNNYENFMERELETRELLRNPPYTRLILLRISGEKENALQENAMKLGDFIQNQTPTNLEVLGPIEAPIYKVNKRFYWNILLKSDSGRLLREFCRSILWGKKSFKVTKGVRIRIDVDPQNMI